MVQLNHEPIPDVAGFYVVERPDKTRTVAEVVRSCGVSFIQLLGTDATFDLDELEGWRLIRAIDLDAILI